MAGVVAERTICGVRNGSFGLWVKQSDRKFNKKKNYGLPKRRVRGGSSVRAPGPFSHRLEILRKINYIRIKVFLRRYAHFFF